MPMRLLIPIILMLCGSGVLHAQQPDTAVKAAAIPALPANYLATVSAKTEKYYTSITTKTEKTLTKLSKWEAKIKTILEKTSPETAQRLFGNNQLTFAGLLQQYKAGKVAADRYQAQYNEYRDKVTTTVKYLDDKKQQFDSNLLKPLAKAKTNTTKLNDQLKNTEATAAFIKQRKKQLTDMALQYLGKSKYLQKIGKENFYYLESLKNFKETFSDPKKTEELAIKLLQKLPGFDAFMRKNSILASLFNLTPNPSAEGEGSVSLAGLQTRAQVNGLIQQQLSAGGPNAQQQFQQSMQAAQSQLNELKNKIIKGGGSSSNDNIAEGFKPNDQRSKTFWQKWELGMNIQSSRGTSIYPVSSDLGLSAGFRPHNKFVAGVGFAGRIGWGRDIRHISLSYSGISARSFAEWKLKGSFHAAAGFEMNYRPEIRQLEVLKDYSSWQRSGLVGISKVLSLSSPRRGRSGGGFFKKTKLQLLWDFMSYQQMPRTQPVLVRLGYGF